MSIFIDKQGTLVKLLNIFFAFFRCGLFGVLFGNSIIVSSAWAHVVDITAVFAPDPTRPNKNKFINVTPISGYCAQFPTDCKSLDMFSLRVPIQFSSSMPIVANHSSVRSGAMIKAPRKWRELTVLHSATGQLHKVKVRISGIGSTYRTSAVRELVGLPDATNIQAHAALWVGSGWNYAPSPCAYSGMGLATPTDYVFFWKTPVDGVCAKKAAFDIPWLQYQYLDFAYEIITPDPLGMSSGQYTGQAKYSIGPGGDFDMGDIMIPSDEELTLNFKLEVDHVLKVEIPPGGNRVELLPEGGWQAWLQSSVRPRRLFRDQTFVISASSPFSMKLNCGVIYGAYSCAVKSSDGVGVLLEVIVSVTLPKGFTQSGNNLPVNNVVLERSHRVGFKPDSYVNRQPATLHFRIVNVPQALSHRGKTFSSAITVVWDSEV